MNLYLKERLNFTIVKNLLHNFKGSSSNGLLPLMSKKQLTFYILISKNLYDVGVFLFCEATKGTAIKTDIGVRPSSVHLF